MPKVGVIELMIGIIIAFSGIFIMMIR